jgi:hypothetical protein
MYDIVMAEMYDIGAAAVTVAPVWLVAIGAGLYLWEVW